MENTIQEGHAWALALLGNPYQVFSGGLRPTPVWAHRIWRLRGDALPLGSSLDQDRLLGHDDVRNVPPLLVH